MEPCRLINSQYGVTVSLLYIENIAEGLDEAPVLEDDFFPLTRGLQKKRNPNCSVLKFFHL